MYWENGLNNYNKDKKSLIYRQNSFIISLPISVLLLAFQRDVGHSNNFAAIPTFGGGFCTKINEYLTT
jgi:hypothetical protein